MYFTGKRNFEHFEFNNRHNGASNKFNKINNNSKKRPLPLTAPIDIPDNDDEWFDNNYLSSFKLPDLPMPTTDGQRRQRVDFVRREMRYRQMPQWDFSIPEGIEDYMRNPKRRYYEWVL